MPASGAACVRATALIAAGRYPEAREAAKAALEAEGPEPALFLALARAHMAEDEDDHDDEAERVFRRALDAFPDDLDLLAGYAELCLRSDPLDRPGRHRRGPVLLERLRELAPDSPQLRRADASTDVLAATAGRGPSAARVQRHDVVHALTSAASPEAAGEEVRRQVARAPHDRRLAVLDASLDALGRPGRAPLRRLVLRRPEYLLVVQLVVAALVIARFAVEGFPVWIPFAVAVIADLPLLALGLLLRGARAPGGERMSVAVDGERTPGAAEGEQAPRSVDGERTPVAVGGERTPVAEGGERAPRSVDGGSAVAEPYLPEMPRRSRRELVLVGAGAAVLLGAGVTTGTLAYAEYTAYPRYEAVAPDSFRGMARMDVGAVPEGAGFGSSSGRVETSFNAVYTGGSGDGSGLSVTASIGDFHDATVALVEESGALLASTPGVTPLGDGWMADAGAYGGWMRCDRYTEDLAGTPKAVCFWTDRGSMGAVTFRASEAMTDAEVEQLARMTRQTELRPVS
ncbi:hypothetical protein ACIPQJ_02125 [Streptomyces sp. NPDC090082]|uniref:hypothetical protein n=1 Tax=unclassified Streptomyces TaxID=2593676 RepID=UPI0038147CF8